MAYSRGLDNVKTGLNLQFLERTCDPGMRVRTINIGAMFFVEYESAVKHREDSVLLDLERQSATARNSCDMLMIALIVVVVCDHGIF